jgi:superfamily II DNA or RNA helicase
MKEPQLFPFQEELLHLVRDAYRRSRRVLLQSPTGSGKTIMFLHMLVRLIARGMRVCLLVHRRELVDQLHRYLEELGIEHGIVAAGYRGDFVNRDALVQVASIPSLARRLVQYPHFDMLVVDEAHHSISPSYCTILAAYPAAWVLGVTATPCRLDGKGLGDIYETLVCGKQIAELEALGFLTPLTVYTTPSPDLSRLRILGGDYSPGALAAAMSDGKLIGNAVEHWRKYAAGQPTIAFGATVAHSQLIAARFNQAEIPVVHIDGKSTDDDRRAAIEGLRTGAIFVLCNCGLISEGVDVPILGAVIMLRPTKSLTLYLQMVGRAGRRYPGKDRAVILDHCGNTHEHGLPNAERQWSLEGIPPRETRAAPAKECPNCGALIPLGSRVCSNCNYLLIDTKPPQELEGRLIKVDDTTLLLPHWLQPRSNYQKKLQWAGADEKRLRAVAEICGYGRRWVEYRLKDFRAGRLR